MILNSGLDAACVNNARGLSQHMTFGAFIRYAAFGTGSTSPDPTQTQLDAQVGARSDNTGGFSNAETGGVDASSNVVWYEGSHTRVFNIESNVNATEWGLAAGTTGNLSVRDLFRADPNNPLSSPITLTLEDGDQLQLVITLRVEARWEYDPVNLVITGAPGNDSNGTHDAIATVSPGSATTSAAAIEALQAVWPGGPNANTGADGGYVKMWHTDQSGRGKADNMPSPSGQYTGVAASYVPGSFHRDATLVLATGEANGDIYALAIGSNNSGSNAWRGLRFIFTDPPYLTKTGSHRLTLNYRRSIVRL